MRHPQTCQNDELIKQTHNLIQSACVLVTKARELRERARDITQDNADLREFLLEARLIAQTRYEQWEEDRRVQHG